MKEGPVKDFKTFAYDVSRAYVEDNQSGQRKETVDRILGWIRSRNLPSLASCSSLIDPHSDVDEYRFLLQVEAFFKKNAVYSDPVACLSAAKASFAEAERRCRRANKRLSYYFSKRERLAPDLRMWMERMESDIATLLGPISVFTGSILRYLRVTSGATATLSRRNAIPPLRVRKNISCTPRCFPFVKSLADELGYVVTDRKCVTWNRVEFVPKNWKTYRTIACEPEGNVPFQLAFDSFAKHRLKRWRVDLSDQSRNQSMAYKASLCGDFSTVDLSMASDTLSQGVVWSLFPYDWAFYLDSVRCQFGNLDGVLIPYEKFSSMGNGSTFAIETIVFAAACRAVGSRDYAVYGDDIVIETPLVDNLFRLLRFLGFVPNQDKTHVSGSFRESCGTNWFAGVDVTPFYIRDLDRRKAVMCHNVNGLASIASGDRLFGLLRSLLRDFRLPLAPFNEDTLSGVFIDIPTAYRLRLLRRDPKSHHRGSHSVWFKAFKPVTYVRKFHDHRTLFLWHLQANRVKRPTWKVQEDGNEGLSSCRYTMTRHKYARKWVRWLAPAVVTPVHLYWWTDFIAE